MGTCREAERIRTMGKDLPRGHVAKNSGEVAKHGRHVDLVAPTSYGSHQVRVVDIGGGHGELAFDENGKYVGELGYDPKLGGHVVVDCDDQHNFRNEFVAGRDRFSFDVNDPNFFANRDDRLLPNSGIPDPRGTAMGGYNPRR